MAVDITLEDVKDFDKNEISDIAVDEYIETLQDFFETAYKRDLEYLASNYPAERSIDVDYKKLEAFDLNLAEMLLDNPQIIFEAAKAAIKKIDVGILDLEGDMKFEPTVRFYNLPEEYRIDIRNVGSDNLQKLISVEGVVRQITERLERLTTAHFICRKCGTGVDVPQKTPQIVRPMLCPECKGREFDIALDQSAFIDYQKIEIQEPLENLKGNDQPNSMDIHLSEDLVNRCSAGDKIIVTGIVKLKQSKNESNIYDKYVIANHLDKLEQEFEELKILPEEEQEIKELSKKDNIYELLAQSVAPNIYGHQIVKEAITLQMFGGVRKDFAKQSLRGNIHVLLVGDPSTGKSQLLKYADNLAPKSIYVAGKTASGAGLTVSAVKDEFGEGGWTLKAGAVVMASGGIAMIDEFDKMSNEDRSALHEAMAQSTVSVSKAGLYSKFRADTSILAAANPKFSRFDKFKNPIEQIDLPFSLISRFDLYFVITDTMDKNLDYEMSKHILQTHEIAEKLASTDRRKSISKEDIEIMESKILPKVDPSLFKKYVAYARQNIKPVLTDKSTKKILDYYIELRDMGRKSNSFTATPRQLEGLIRLSEASAKIRLKEVIEESDAERAIKIFKTSLEQTALDAETGKIDIDILTTGQSHSERTLIKNVLQLIKELSANGEPVSINDILDVAEAKNIPKDKLGESISKLKKMGEIYEPKAGSYKAVEQNSF